jgi:hypothetical protein
MVKAKEPPPKPDDEVLAVIDAPHFYAGIVLRDDHVIDAAPIVKYMKDDGGWSRQRVREYCQIKGWHVAVVATVTANTSKNRPIRPLDA